MKGNNKAFGVVGIRTLDEERDCAINRPRRLSKSGGQARGEEFPRNRAMDA